MIILTRGAAGPAALPLGLGGGEGTTWGVQGGLGRLGDDGLTTTFLGHQHVCCLAFSLPMGIGSLGVAP
eukprot:1464767-Pyramimonas_sp.AAC.1